MRTAFHGDVILIETDNFPTNLKPVSRNPKYDNAYILAEGEVTGHAHRINDEVELYEHNGTLYMRNLKDVTITHEEHKPSVIPAGNWEIRITKEYDFLSEEARKVAD